MVITMRKRTLVGSGSSGGVSTGAVQAIVRAMLPTAETGKALGWDAGGNLTNIAAGGVVEAASQAEQDAAAAAGAKLIVRTDRLPGATTTTTAAPTTTTTAAPTTTTTAGPTTTTTTEGPTTTTTTDAPTTTTTTAAPTTTTTTAAPTTTTTTTAAPTTTTTTEAPHTHNYASMPLGNGGVNQAIPAGTLDTDLLLLCLVGSISSVAGWTKKIQTPSLSIFERSALGATAVNGVCYGAILVVRGADTSTPTLYGTTGAASGAGVTLTAPAVNAPNDHTHVIDVMGFMVDDEAGGCTTNITDGTNPTGWVNQYRIDNADEYTNRVLKVSAKDLVAGGDSGAAGLAVTLTPTGIGNAVQIALHGLPV